MIRNKNILLAVVILGLAVSFGAMSSTAYAVNAPPSPLGNIPSGSTTIGADVAYTSTSIAGKIAELVNWFSWGIALVSVVMGLYAGFLFITARGEAAQLKTARATLLWAVIGIAVAVLSFSIISITKAIFTL